MTEFAPVFGTEPGTVCVGIGSSDSRDFAVLRCVRRGRGVALAVASESDFAVAADFDFECCRCGTPVRRTSFGFSSSDVIAACSASPQRSAQPTAQEPQP